MRRKGTRSTSKPTLDAKSETRKSTRSRRKQSPSKSQDSEDENAEITSSNTTEHNEIINDQSVPKEINEETDSKLDNEEVESENTSHMHNEFNKGHDSLEGGHTPPPIEPKGNDAQCEEVDVEKGKSKGINNSQVEDNSEIKMNSVNSDGAEGFANPEPNLKHNECSNDNSVIQEQVQKEKSLEKEDVPEDSVNIDNSGETVAENALHEGGEVENVNSEISKMEIEKTNGDKQIEADEDQAEEGEIRESKSDEENENYGEGTEVKKPRVRIKLRRDSFFDTIANSVDSSAPIKKIKWNPEEHKCLKLSFPDVYKLQVDDFKSLSTDLKLADEKDLKLEEKYKPKLPELVRSKERLISTGDSKDDAEAPEYMKQLSTGSSEEKETTNIIALNRKISIVDDTASKLNPPPSPAKNPISSVLYISNLVRPFTLKQLRELLERTGTIKDDGFWTDRIKSKCYVQYESLEEAESTRNALHGVNWPIGNGKKLVIEYATEEEMELAKNPPIQPVAPPAQVAPPRPKTPQKENADPMREQRNGDRREERKRKESERERERGRNATSREWDVGKQSRRERSLSRSRERRRKHSGRRSITPLEDFIARKQRKLEESVPQKLMDDLFQRTKAMPCIYWQPLSPEEISIKQQQRLTRMEEHKRRLEENSRNRGGVRDPGRGGAYRRRYD